MVEYWKPLSRECFILPVTGADLGTTDGQLTGLPGREKIPVSVDNGREQPRERSADSDGAAIGGDIELPAARLEMAGDRGLCRTVLIVYSTI